MSDRPARYVVGIDLGTTNCAVAYVDLEEPTLPVRMFLVPQLVGPGQIEPRETLPSFLYQPAASEFPPEAIRLEWPEQDHCLVGVLARDQGVRAPGRVVSSAKSWLSHAGVDRTANLLPWQGMDDVERMSPVEASARLLGHMRSAWNARHREHPLEDQDVVITLPASFDEVARELTVRAARQAGLPRIVLIEEPQAAFYAWINKHRDNWQSRIDAGQTILVCDIGGGTTDFTLIRARPAEGGSVAFHRVAVGDHLILGGDNLDLALARRLESQLSGSTPLESRAWESLVRQCRAVKETLLGDDAPEWLTVHLAGRGAGLIGGARQVVANRDELRAFLLDGFLPQVDLGDRPTARQSGFQEFGLPFAADPAITRHLAAFLTAHRPTLADERQRENRQTDEKSDPARPDAILFNGGFFTSPALRERFLDVVTRWFGGHEEYQPLLLDNDALYLAVARGAAYYGLVRRGHGVRISAGLARTYYVGVEAADGSQVALCLVPAGAEPGQTFELAEPRFELRVSEPIELSIFTSAVRLTDKPGQRVAIDPVQLTALPPIRTVLRSRQRDEGAIPVKLVAGLSELGTLELSCHELQGKRSWRLQFDVRSATRTDIAAHESAAEAEGVLDEDLLSQVTEALEAVWGPTGTAKPKEIMGRLTEIIGAPRDEWPTSLLRRMWETLLNLEQGRRKSPAHEVRWLNLTGFALRPGYGYALDDWRVAETWKTLRNRLVHAKPECVTQWRIFWRRIAGGLEAGQQQTLADPVLSELRQIRPGGRSFDSAGAGEVFRLLASLERLSPSRKVEIGRLAGQWLANRSTESLWPVLAWSIGRLGARIPLYGPLNSVVPPEDVTPWIQLLLKSNLPVAVAAFPLVQMAVKTGDRFRDVPDSPRDRVTAWLERESAGRHYLDMVRSSANWELADRATAFGESLPRGLRLGSES